MLAYKKDYYTYYYYEYYYMNVLVYVYKPVLKEYYYQEYVKDNNDFTYMNKEDYCPRNSSNTNLCTTLNEF